MDGPGERVCPSAKGQRDPRPTPPQVWGQGSAGVQAEVPEVSGPRSPPMSEAQKWCPRGQGSPGDTRGVRGILQGLRASEAHGLLLSRGGWAPGCRLPPGPAGGQRGGLAPGVLLTCGPVTGAARAQGQDGRAGSSLSWCPGCGQTTRVSTAFAPAGLSVPCSRSDPSGVRTVILAVAGSSAVRASSRFAKVVGSSPGQGTYESQPTGALPLGPARPSLSLSLSQREGEGTQK